jgi:curved DNA-binding protein CbpA
MDPYLILKLRRDCTPTEVKETFRAKVQLDHPDHGGDEKQFIKLCTAYRMILQDLDAVADIEAASQSADDAKSSKPTDSRSAPERYVDPYLNLLRRVSTRSDAGKAQGRPGPLNVRDRRSRKSAGAIVVGVLVLGFFLASILAALHDADPLPVRSAASRVDLGRVTPALPENPNGKSRTESLRSTSQAEIHRAESIKMEKNAGKARDFDFQSIQGLKFDSSL